MNVFIRSLFQFRIKIFKSENKEEVWRQTIIAELERKLLPKIFFKRNKKRNIITD